MTRGDLGAHVIRRLLLEPGRWSARALAAELGEGSPRRVQRIVAEMEAAGWTVTRDRRTPRWETARDWPWPLTLEEVALRLYGETDAGARRQARTLVGNWLRLGFLVHVGWARYGLRPQDWEE
ncbi:hypothetical protein D9600_14545 [Deinococcus sp. DB0503]|nr:hypothetical protein [Deinococcus sp. DB0503]